CEPVIFIAFFKAIVCFFFAVFFTESFTVLAFTLSGFAFLTVCVAGGAVGLGCVPAGVTVVSSVFSGSFSAFSNSA
ncbi:MAG: hypothetical protein IJ121_05360, partial [Eubacterium sp.]|nr:hypothetical protein [Eubacterium sp.]